MVFQYDGLARLVEQSIIESDAKRESIRASLRESGYERSHILKPGSGIDYADCYMGDSESFIIYVSYDMQSILQQAYGFFIKGNSNTHIIKATLNNIARLSAKHSGQNLFWRTISHFMEPESISAYSRLKAEYALERYETLRQVTGQSSSRHS